ncbi:hypothetical protein BDA96_10G191800 [Sorghum bicolor]|uniref:Transposase Tnp1/En/Spm-like domain-containing protein n=2 Tax=Sorghum bicolor TaxID=4558 RepID=A0A921Q2V7_SORBI|nr:hypothetical protein BDA96_10G191800 [Sorghum bicolor]KAG0514440.1 hypothetical protein BDA96_10G191800 [Sorghum bicolor]
MGTNQLACCSVNNFQRVQTSQPKAPLGESREKQIQFVCHSYKLRKGPMITFANGEVILDVVIRREALAPRPYAEIKTIGDALKMPLAWPFNRPKACCQQPRSQGVVGSSQRSSQGAAGSS